MPTALQLLVTSGSPGGELACPQRSSISHLERLLFSQKHTHLPALLAMPAEFTAAPSCGKSWVGASKRDPHKGSNSSDTTWLLASTAQVNIPAGDWQRLHSHELRRKHTKAEGQAGPRDGRGQCWQRQAVLSGTKSADARFLVIGTLRDAQVACHTITGYDYAFNFTTLANDFHSLFRLPVYLAVRSFFVCSAVLILSEVLKNIGVQPICIRAFLLLSCSVSLQSNFQHLAAMMPRLLHQRRGVDLLCLS